MRKLFIVAAGLLLTAAGAQAQDNPTLPAAPVPPASAAIQPAGPDSVQGVRTLFRKRRNGGALFAGAGGLLAVRGVLAEGDANQLGSVLVGLPLLGFGVSKLLRFGNKKEEAYIKAYQAGQPLPARIRRHLRPEYLKPTPKP